MSMTIPESYITARFYQYAGFAEQTRSYYVASCPICHEGNSYGKKKRLYYFPDEQYLYCHNCAQGWSPYFWLKTVTGMSFKEIIKDVEAYTGESIQSDFRRIKIEDDIVESSFDPPVLPGVTVDIRDEMQIQYYGSKKIINIAKEYCTARRLLSAINAPSTYYVCIQDYLHNNRLVIPYYDSCGRVESYISRKLLATDNKAKYLLKLNSKPVFNLHKIDNSYPYIFIFEGALDAIFVKNGVAISGVSMTDKQAERIRTLYPFHTWIWVLDNYKLESEQVRKKIKDKLLNQERVFIYEKDVESFKDINEFCVQKNRDQFDPDFLVEHSYVGNRGLIRL